MVDLYKLNFFLLNYFTFWFIFDRPCSELMSKLFIYYSFHISVFLVKNGLCVLERGYFTFMETSLSVVLTPDELLDYIEYLRNNLINIGLSNGFNHEKTIEASQELDYFILEYQRLISLFYHKG